MYDTRHTGYSTCPRDEQENDLDKRDHIWSKYSRLTTDYFLSNYRVRARYSGAGRTELRDGIIGDSNAEERVQCTKITTRDHGAALQKQ